MSASSSMLGEGMTTYEHKQQSFDLINKRKRRSVGSRKVNSGRRPAAV